MSIISGDAEIERRLIPGVATVYAVWRPSEDYLEGDWVEYNEKLYRASVSHTSGTSFSEAFWAPQVYTEFSLEGYEDGVKTMEISPDINGVLGFKAYGGIVVSGDAAAGRIDLSFPEMVGATATSAGTAGLVPPPGAGSSPRFLNSAGDWVEVSGERTYTLSGDATGTFPYTGTDLNIAAGDGITLEGQGNSIIISTREMVGATATATGVTGTVPPAQSSRRNYYLRGDGTWFNPQFRIIFTDAGGSGMTGGGTVSPDGDISITAGSGVRFDVDEPSNSVVISITEMEFISDTNSAVVPGLIPQTTERDAVLTSRGWRKPYAAEEFNGPGVMVIRDASDSSTYRKSWYCIGAGPTQIDILPDSNHDEPAELHTLYALQGAVFGMIRLNPLGGSTANGASVQQDVDFTGKKVLFVLVDNNAGTAQVWGY